MSTKHDTLDSWVEAFEKWSGLSMGAGRSGTSELMLEAIQEHPTAWRIEISTPTGVCIGTFTVFKSTEGWQFGGCSTVFPEDRKTLCRL